jgi:alpha 1,3-glucosidase
LQKCKNAAFCERLRGTHSDYFVVDPQSVKVQGSRVTATVVNNQDSNGTFSLALTAYQGIVRLHIDEVIPKGRYEVKDVLLPGLDAREQVCAMAGV